MIHASFWTRSYGFALYVILLFPYFFGERMSSALFLSSHPPPPPTSFLGLELWWQRVIIISNGKIYSIAKKHGKVNLIGRKWSWQSTAVTKLTYGVKANFQSIWELINLTSPDGRSDIPLGLQNKHYNLGRSNSQTVKAI